MRTMSFYDITFLRRPRLVVHILLVFRSVSFSIGVVARAFALLASFLIAASGSLQLHAEIRRCRQNNGRLIMNEGMTDDWRTTDGRRRSASRFYVLHSGIMIRKTYHRKYQGVKSKSRPY